MIRTTTLPNGLEVAVEESPAARSVALGFFAKTGARDEPAEWEGISHFLEHMCFKGTPTRDTLTINRLLDEMGAKANAWTSWEETAYFVQVLPEKVATGVELLSDMMRPALRDEDFALEKKVILEEIALYEDRPDFLLFDHALVHRFAGHPLGRRILGKPGTIGPLACESMRKYHAERYAPAGMRFVATGAVRFDEILPLVAARTTGWRTGPAPDRSYPPVPPAPAGLRVERPKDHEVRLVRLYPAPPAQDEAGREAARLFAMTLGDSIGSRLYWGLVHTGLAEEASFFHEPFDRAGLFGGLLVAERKNFEKARGAFDRILAEALAQPPSDDEIARAQQKTVTEIRLAAESPLSRFRALGGRLLDGIPLREADELVARIRAVTPDSVRASAVFLREGATEILLS